MKGAKPRKPITPDPDAARPAASSLDPETERIIRDLLFELRVDLHAATPEELAAKPLLRAKQRTYDRAELFLSERCRRGDLSADASSAAFVTANEAAEYLGVSRQEVYDACSLRGLRHVKLGAGVKGRIRIRKAWLDEWMDTRSTENRFL